MWIYEHEANERQCPQTQGPCRGQGCMAWRWGFLNKIDNPTAYKGKSFSGAEVGLSEAQLSKFPQDQRFRGRKGYCGLAGKPSE